MPAASVERIVKSFAFSVILAVVSAVMTWKHVRLLTALFSWLEFLWLLYNGTITLLFLIRETPKRVSLNPLHWLVAMVTSFSGLFFARSAAPMASAANRATGIMAAGVVLGLLAAIHLGRSYDPLRPFIAAPFPLYLSPAR